MERFTRPLMQQIRRAPHHRQGRPARRPRGGLRASWAAPISPSSAAPRRSRPPGSRRSRTWTSTTSIPRSLWKFRVRGFGPLLVAMDSHGGSLYREVRTRRGRRGARRCSRRWASGAGGELPEGSPPARLRAPTPRAFAAASRQDRAQGDAIAARRSTARALCALMSPDDDLPTSSLLAFFALLNALRQPSADPPVLARAEACGTSDRRTPRLPVAREIGRSGPLCTAHVQRVSLPARRRLLYFALQNTPPARPAGVGHFRPSIVRRTTTRPSTAATVAASRAKVPRATSRGGRPSPGRGQLSGVSAPRP